MSKEEIITLEDLNEEKTISHIDVDAENPDIIDELEQAEKAKKKQKILEDSKKTRNKNELDGIITKQEIAQSIASNNRPEATEGIVEYIYEQNRIGNHFKTTRNDNNSEIWIYQGGIYVPEGKSYIQEFCRQILGKLFTKQLCNEVISKIEADTFIKQEDFFNQQNKTPYLIPTENCLLNIKTREVLPFDPDKYFFNKLPLEYNPKATCEKFKEFLDGILEKETDKLTIQELFGFALLKDYRYKKSFMFEGKGDNGKTQLLNLLKDKFIGVNNSCSVSLAALEKDGFILSEFHNKLVNVSADITSTALNDTGVYKQLTGKDDIQANRKHKNHITFQNYAKMIFATNSLPTSNDVSDGFWTRWILIEFPYRFLTKKEIDLIPKEERQNIKLANPRILEEITTPQEISGILNWALDGLERLEKNKDFSYSKSKNEVKRRWLEKSNTVMSFIDQFVEEDWDNSITKKEFKQRYLAYCNNPKNKLKTVSDKLIKKTLEDELGAVTDRMWIDGETERERVWIWSGIKFKEVDTVDSLPTQSDFTRKIEVSRAKLNTLSKLSTVSSLIEKQIIENPINKDNLILLLSRETGLKNQEIEDKIKELIEKGDIIENPKNVIRRLD